MRAFLFGGAEREKVESRIVVSEYLRLRMLHCKTSYPSPADLESLGSKLSDVIEQAESGDIG